MPIKHVAGGYRWGEHGHVYATREGAEKQAEAAYAHGYAGDAATQGAGLLMCTPQGKALFLRRSDSAQDCAGMWDLPGGTADAGETPLDTARREAVEEIGDVPEGQTELLTDILADEVRFVTFLHMIKQEFAPDLNDEHSDSVWADLDNPPEPLHPGVRRTLAAMQAPKMAGDAEFKEGDHPRAENGQFGSGGSPTQSNQYDHEKIAKSLKLSGWNKGNIQEGKRHLYLGSTAAKQLALMAGYKMTREPDGRDVINASNNEFEIIGKQWLEKKEESRKNKAAFKEKQKQIAASKEKTKTANDSFAMDRGESGQPRGERIAFDKKSVRSFDQDGRMRVAVTPISKANVCPYLGREIPGCEELGLDHDKQYRLYRDPEELAKAAPTFNNLPILSRHVPVTAEKPMKDLVIGATGTDAAFDAPYLTNALMFWDAEAIQAIESDKQRELSCAYHYVPDMTPGVFEGQPYDGVMRAIRGNHVALVIEGRAGPDVIVADHLPLEIDRMTTAQNVLSRKAVLAKGALSVGLPPLMARSRQLTREALGLALDEALKGVASDNWRKAKPAVVAKLKPLLASDSNVAKLTELLDNLDSGKREGDDEAEMVDGEKQVKVDTDPTLAKKQGEGEDDEPTMMKPEGMDDDEIDGPNPEGAPKGENAVGDPVKEILDLIGHEHPNYQAVSDKLGALQAAGEPAPKDRPAGDEPPSSPAQPKAPTGAVMKGQTEVKQGETATATEKPVTKAAMDAAIRQAQAQVRATHEALEFVAPWVGKLSAIAFDSAEQVYAKALELRGRPTKDIHPSAYKAILEVLPKPGAAIEQTPRLGQDAVKTPDNFASLFPDAGRVRRV